MDYIGRNGSRFLFVSDILGAVVDESKNLVVALDVKEPLIAASTWNSETDRPKGPSV